MERILRMDDWLIDNVAQPLASWYEFVVGGKWWHLSVVMVGLQFATLVVAMALDVALGQAAAQRALSSFFAGAISILGFLSMWGRAMAARRIRLGMVNPYRRLHIGQRIGIICATCAGTLLFPLAAQSSQKTIVMCSLIFLSLCTCCFGEYFFACNGMTPHERKEREEKELLKHAPQPI